MEASTFSFALSVVWYIDHMLYIDYEAIYGWDKLSQTGGAGGL